VHSIVACRRLSSPFSSCRDILESILEFDVGAANAAEDGDEFVRDGDCDGAIFLVGNHLRDRGVSRVVDELQDPCREYFKLYLCDNRIGHLGAYFISCALYDSNLMELSLGNNHIGDEGAKHLAHSLMFNSTLKMLNLEKNNISPEGITVLAKCLERNNTGLQWLVLSGNPLGDEGVGALLRCVGNSSSFDTLLKCNHSLRSVILKKVTHVTDNASLRKIQCHLKINRMSAPSSTSAAQRKVLRFAKENHSSLLEYISTIQSDNAAKDMHCISQILALLGFQCDLSTLLHVLKNMPCLFSKCPDTIVEQSR
jgi:Ran GTPase-activating protein (RanGAP) involved in mRNA processing and transport